MEEQVISVRELRNLKNSQEYEVWDERFESWVNIQDSTYLVKGKNAGFAPTTDPFNPVTAISLYLDWMDQLITLCISPNHCRKNRLMP